MRNVDGENGSVSSSSKDSLDTPNARVASRAKPQLAGQVRGFVKSVEKHF